MKKTLISGIVGLALVLPVAAFADSRSEQLQALYTQLVALLTQELALLKGAQAPALNPALLVIDQPSGKAPYSALISLPERDGTETVDFGDGHATGTQGCTVNAKGWCDLGQQVAHTYQYPGTYTVTLYRHTAGVKEGYKVSQTKVAVE
jgi:hypothetical protein